ncbi:hypothetical protein B0H14DRAFT_2643047 [Mycena olivaceomarginata]|nr:hypothetical protein B0H14DRAFT_2643047 [Mycena olivaceomarginata]
MVTLVPCGFPLMSCLILLLCRALKALNSVVQSSHLMPSWCTSSGVSLGSYYWDLGRLSASGVWTVSSKASTLGWDIVTHIGPATQCVLQVGGGELWWSGRVRIQGYADKLEAVSGACERERKREHVFRNSKRILNAWVWEEPKALCSAALRADAAPSGEADSEHAGKGKKAVGGAPKAPKPTHQPRALAPMVGLRLRPPHTRARAKGNDWEKGREL